MDTFYDNENFPLPGVTVDPLVFTIKNHKLYLLMNKRTKEPYFDYWNIPGGFLDLNSSLLDNAKRILSEKTNLKNIYLEQLYTFGDIDRDPRYRILSVSYLALCPFSSISSQNLNDNSRWILVDVKKDDILLKLDDKIINDNIAFDHLKIIKYAIARMQNKLNYTDIAFSLLEDKFTLYDLQNAYELILGHEIHKSNFRRDISSKVVKLDIICNDKKGRPCYYYRRKNDEDFSGC